MSMTRRDHIVIAKVIRDTTYVDSEERASLAGEMASALEPLSKRFDRELFIAFATSAVDD